MVHSVNRIDLFQKLMSGHLNLGIQVKDHIENADDACNHIYEYDGFTINVFACHHC